MSNAQSNNRRVSTTATPSATASSGAVHAARGSRAARPLKPAQKNLPDDRRISNVLRSECGIEHESFALVMLDKDGNPRLFGDPDVLTRFPEQLLQRGPQRGSGRARSGPDGQASLFGRVDRGRLHAGRSGRTTPIPRKRKPASNATVRPGDRPDKRPRLATQEQVAHEPESEPEEISDLSPPCVTIMIGDEEKVLQFYLSRLNQLQQQACRTLAKAWIKRIHPKKQTTHPYRHGSDRAPHWWPAGVTHREPDHIKKTERMCLLTCILRLNFVEIDQLEAATDELGNPLIVSRKALLDEIYRVARQEARYRRGEIDGDTSIPIAAEAKDLLRANDAAAEEVDEPENMEGEDTKVWHRLRARLDSLYARGTWCDEDHKPELGGGGGDGDEDEMAATHALEDAHEHMDESGASPVNELIDLGAAAIVEPRREPHPKPVAYTFGGPVTSAAAAAAGPSPSSYSMPAAHGHATEPFVSTPSYLTGREHLGSSHASSFTRPPSFYNPTGSSGPMAFDNWHAPLPFEPSPTMSGYGPYMAQPPTVPSQRAGVPSDSIVPARPDVSAASWLDHTSAAGLGSSGSLVGSGLKHSPDTSHLGPAAVMAGSPWYGTPVQPNPPGQFGVGSYGMAGFGDYGAAPMVHGSGHGHNHGHGHGLGGGGGGGGGMGMGGLDDDDDSVKLERRE